MQKNNKQLAFYYAILIGASLVGIAYGFFFSALFFPSDKAPWIETLMTVLKLSWLIALPYALLNYYSLARYPAISSRPDGQPEVVPSAKLYFRFVTRGDYPSLIAESTASSRRVLSACLPPDRWTIEVVSNTRTSLLQEDEQLRQILIPPNYLLPKGTRFKARALQYAMQSSDARPEDWIIHLDEETFFDDATIRAICSFVLRESKRLTNPRAKPTLPRIGQGVVLYGTGRIVNWVTTLADSIRVGDDYGRFRFQFENGMAYFGMHGSFVVVSNRVEKLVGFDHGFAGSITEDAYFALMAQTLGVEFEFLHGFMYEKSPFSVRDFIRQRRRWFSGLWLCTLSSAIPLRQRLVLGSFMVLWSLSWLSIAMVYINFFFPTGTPIWLAVTGGVSFSYYVLLYLTGYGRTFDWRASKSVFLLRLLAQIVLIPVFSVMEALGVFYAIVSPLEDFYVVQKEVPVLAAQPISSRRIQTLPGVLAHPAFFFRGLSRQAPWVPSRIFLRWNALWQRISVHDALTGRYTYSYWLQALLHFLDGGTFRRPQPAMCLTLEVNGLEELRARNGASAADRTLIQIGVSLAHNLRDYDLVCRYREEHFIAALLQCSPQVGSIAGKRVAANVSQQLLAEVNNKYSSHVSLTWRIAHLPGWPSSLEVLQESVRLIFGQPALVTVSA